LEPGKSSASSAAAGDEPAARVPISGEILPDLAPVIAERAAPRRFEVLSESGNPPPTATCAEEVSAPAFEGATGGVAGAASDNFNDFRVGNDFVESTATSGSFWSGASAMSADQGASSSALLATDVAFVAVSGLSTISGRFLPAGGSLAARPAMDPLSLAPAELDCRGSAAEDADVDGRREP
jgi:hypothetical protein